MTTSLLIRVLLAVHLCGLIFMAGTTAVDYYTFRLFCTMYDAGADGLLPIMSRYGVLVRTGAAVLILSGLAMVTIKATLWNQGWFMAKIALVVMLVINGMFIGNALGLKFRKAITAGTPSCRGIAEYRTNLNLFYLAQLSIFLMIIFLSTIRPGQAVTK